MTQRRARVGMMVAAVIAVVGAFAGSQAAVATTSPATPDRSTTVDWLEAQGVDKSTTDALVARLDRGELLDSQMSASEPVKTDVVDGGTATRLVYQDGSVRVLSATQDNTPGVADGITPLVVNTISGCANHSTSNIAIFSGCLIKFEDGVTVLKFKTGYSRWSTGAHVSNWGSMSAATAYGHLTTPKFTFIRADYSASAGPATVQMHTRFTSWNGLSSEDMYLSLKVTPSKVSVDND